MKKRPRSEVRDSRGRLRGLISAFDFRLSTLPAAAWLLFIVAVYFRLQIERALKMAGAIP